MTTKILIIYRINPTYKGERNVLKVSYNPQVTFCGFAYRKINKFQNTAKLTRLITVVQVFSDSDIGLCSTSSAHTLYFSFAWSFSIQM